MTIAASEYYNLEFMHAEISKIYHRFGKFYVLNSGLQRPEPTSSVPSGAKPAVSEPDLDRARFYFRHAAELDRQNAPALNDLGYVQLLTGQIAESKGAFEKSLAIDPNQQRARYNLAFIALDLDPAESIRLLTEALRMPKWQGSQLAQDHADILYQRACARTKLGKSVSGKERKEQFELAMNDLETAFKNPNRSVVELKHALCGKNHRTIDPDLAPLKDDADVKQRFQKLRDDNC